MNDFDPGDQSVEIFIQSQFEFLESRRSAPASGYCKVNNNINYEEDEEEWTTQLSTLSTWARHGVHSALGGQRHLSHRNTFI